MDWAGRAQNAIIGVLIFLVWLTLQAVWKRLRAKWQSPRLEAPPFRPWRFAYRSAEWASLIVFVVALLWQLASLIGAGRLAGAVGEAIGTAIFVGVMVWAAAAILVVGPILIMRRLAPRREPA